jgi:hypothetical protein
MSWEALDKLVDLLGDLLTANKAKRIASTNKRDPKAAELVVGAGLRYFGGESI